MDRHPNAPPEYTLTVRVCNKGPKLPILTQICRKSRKPLPVVFKHAITPTSNGKTQGIWWNKAIDVLYLDYDNAPHAEHLFRSRDGNMGYVWHLAVSIKIAAELVFRLDVDDDTLQTVSTTLVAKGDLAIILESLEEPISLSIAYPTLLNFLQPSGTHRLDVNIGNNLVAIYLGDYPEQVLKLLLKLEATQNKMLFQDRLFYALLWDFTKQKRIKYPRIVADAAYLWGLPGRPGPGASVCPSLRGVESDLVCQAHDSFRRWSLLPLAPRC